MNASISWLKIKISKMRQGFVDERAMIKTTWISSCHWKSLVYFLHAKETTWKHTFNINSESSQNRTEKQIMPLKTIVNWLFNDMWCYLVIGFFDWKIGVFQQTVVRVYRILNELHGLKICKFKITHLQKKFITRVHYRWSEGDLGLLQHPRWSALW